MELIVDFMLLAASIAAGVYCFVLSERLKKLNDTRSGLGATVASMSSMLDQTRATLEQTKRVNQEGEARLRALIGEADKIAPELECLLEAVASSAESAARDIAQLRRSALQEIRQGVAEPTRARPSARAGLAA